MNTVQFISTSNSQICEVSGHDVFLCDHTQRAIFLIGNLMSLSSVESNGLSLRPSQAWPGYEPEVSYFAGLRPEDAGLEFGCAIVVVEIELRRRGPNFLASRKIPLFLDQGIRDGSHPP